MSECHVVDFCSPRAPPLFGPQRLDISMHNSSVKHAADATTTQTDPEIFRFTGLSAYDQSSSKLMQDFDVNAVNRSGKVR
jgi:hypothetical protein